MEYPNNCKRSFLQKNTFDKMSKKDFRYVETLPNCVLHTEIG